MSKTVWKYVIPEESRFTLDMPQGAVPLCVHVQWDTPHLWACVETTNAPTPHRFLTLGTGHAMPAGRFDYVGTFMVEGGEFIFHVFHQLDEGEWDKEDEGE